MSTYIADNFKPIRPVFTLLPQVDDVLLKKDVALIIILCPPSLHSQIAVKALGIGKHVVCGVPGGLGQAECLRMVQVQLVGALNIGSMSFNVPGSSILPFPDGCSCLWPAVFALDGRLFIFR